MSADMKAAGLFLASALSWLSGFLTPLQAGDIVINEIMADNQTALANAGQYPDWLELYNNTDRDQNLGGASLTDDLLVPGKYVFPPNTILPARGFLLVYCDELYSLVGLHTGFALKADGQTVALFSGGATPTMLDSVTFGPQLPDLSIGRIPDGTGAWQLTAPTAVTHNVAQALGQAGKLKVNEWMASPSKGSDWFELFNPDALPVALGGLSFTDTLDNSVLSPISPLSFIAANGFVQFLADRKPADGPTHVNFKLPASGTMIRLLARDLSVIDTVVFGQQSQDVSQGRLPDGAANIVSFLATPTPGDSNYLPIYNVVINEVLSHTDPPFEDAIELFNPSVADVDISGWYLSNRKDDPKKFRISAGTVLRAGDFHVFYEYQFNPDRNLPSSFTLNSAHGDEVHLSAATGGVLTGHRTSVKFGAADPFVSFGRYVTQTVNDFVPLARTTFGADNPVSVTEFRQGQGLSNALPRVGPVVINEIMYHPPDVVTSVSTNDDVLHEFIELHNITPERTALYDPFFPQNTWRITGGADYTFPPGVSLAPQGFLLVVSFDPVTNELALISFRSRYQPPAGVPILGPYQGKLANGGESLELQKPDAPQMPPHPDAGFVPHVQVDRVRYAPSFPWPSAADGSGASLQRTSAARYGNDPANWLADAPSAGRANSEIQVQSVRRSGDSIVIALAAQAGHTYTVQYRESLSAGAWLKLKDLVDVTATGPREITDLVHLESKARFYRLVSPATP